MNVSLSSLFRKNGAYLRKHVFKPYIKAACMRSIVFYQKKISRHTCMFRPTCSQYTLEAINNKGVLLGIVFGFFRILRCHPFAKKGAYDPAPEKRCVKWVL